MSDENELRSVFDEDQIPAECGGSTTHDQLEWVEFYKVTVTVFFCDRCIKLSDLVRVGYEHFYEYVHATKISWTALFVLIHFFRSNLLFTLLSRLGSVKRFFPSLHIVSIAHYYQQCASIILYCMFRETVHISSKYFTRKLLTK